MSNKSKRVVTVIVVIAILFAVFHYSGGSNYVQEHVETTEMYQRATAATTAYDNAEIIPVITEDAEVTEVLETDVTSPDGALEPKPDK